MLVVRRDAPGDREVTIATLRDLGARPPRKPKVVPWRGIPLAMDVEYQRELAAIVARMEPAFEQLITELPRLLVEARTSRGDSQRADAGEGKRARALVDAAYRAMTALIRVEDVEKVAMKHALRVSDLNSVWLTRAAKAALGVEIALVTPHLGAILEQHVAEVVAHVLAIPELVTVEIEKMLSRAITTGRIDKGIEDLPGVDPLGNAQLIKGITPGQAFQVAEATKRANEAGDLAKTFAKELKERFGFAKRRAELIARDQLGKLNGQVSVARQRAIGLTRFRWRSVRDKRVRPEHRLRDGQIYSYSSPPAGELPGEPVLCRCYPEPMFEDLLDDPIEPSPIERAVPPAPAPPAPPVIPPAPPPPRVRRGPKPLPPRGELPVAAEKGRKKLERVGRDFEQNSFVDKHGNRHRGAWSERDQAAIRSGNDAVLSSYGIGKRKGGALADVVEVRKRNELGSAEAWWQPWDGKIVINDVYAKQLNDAYADMARGNDVAAELRRIGEREASGMITVSDRAVREQQRARVRAVHASIHESTHGRGPLMVYSGNGVFVEEVTTELVARRVTRDLYKLPLSDELGVPGLGVKGGPYGHMIEGATTTIQSVLQRHGITRTADEAFAMLEDAALRYERGTSKVALDPDEQMQKLVASIDLGAVDKKTAAKIRSDLRYFMSSTARQTTRP